MSNTSTMITTEEELYASSILGSSFGSISSPRRSHSAFSKPYKEASNFFLTRRFPEALSCIKPLITVADGDGQITDDSDEIKQAAIAKADRKWRVKVWSFYLTLLNAVADLGEEEWKAVFGRQEWRSLIGKLEDGSIWDEVVNIGYGGIEAHVDAEVVINLANLLLAQSPSQRTTQQRLETYLSAAGQPEPIPDSHVESQIDLDGNAKGQKRRIRETNMLRELETRIRIIEIYALHVLPRNGEWDFARDFIGMSELLDEERKDAFLQTLKELQEEEVEAQDVYEDAIPQQAEADVEAVPSSDITRTDSNVTIKPDSPVMHRPASSENDYGIDDAQPAPKRPTLMPVSPKPAHESAAKPVREPSGTLQPRASRSPLSKSSKSVSQPNVLKRSMAVFTTLQKLISNMTLHMSQNPMMLLRFVVFLMGLIIAFSRRDIRNRLSRLTGAGWDKIRKTVGMGVQVSYI